MDGAIWFTPIASRLLSSHACLVTAADGLTDLRTYATAGLSLIVLDSPSFVRRGEGEVASSPHSKAEPIVGPRVPGLYLT